MEGFPVRIKVTNQKFDLSLNHPAPPFGIEHMTPSFDRIRIPVRPVDIDKEDIGKTRFLKLIRRFLIIDSAAI
jgi:hypothetical protein